MSWLSRLSRLSRRSGSAKSTEKPRQSILPVPARRKLSTTTDTKLSNESRPPNGLDAYPAFKYESRLPSRHIRLLQIYPGEDEDVISCEIFTADLDSHPTFEALSYTWGSNVKSRSLTCDGKRLKITDNLDNALRQFRKSKTYGPIWIDAVSINQEDTIEKTAQVKMMLHIYQSATIVRVWLGEPGNDIFSKFNDKDIEILDRFDAAVTRFLEQKEESREPYVDFLAVERHLSTRQDMHAILNLLARPWFSRMWIIQELLAAKAVNFHLGHFKLDPQKVIRVAFSTKMTKGKGFIMAGKPSHPLHDGYRVAASLAELKLRYSGGKSLRLSELVRCTSFFGATEEKDKVFALVGIASDAEADFIDYGKDMRTLFIDIARNALIKPNQAEAEGLNFLCKIAAPDPEARMMVDWGVPKDLKSQDMPSWAPVLSKTDMTWGDIKPLSDIWGDLGDECALKAELHFGPDETLHVRGKIATAPKVYVIEAPYDWPLQYAEDTKPYFARMHVWIRGIKNITAQVLTKEDEAEDQIIVRTHWFSELSRALVFNDRATKSSTQPFFYRLCFHAFSYYVELMSKDTFSDAFEAAATLANRDFEAVFGKEEGFQPITENDVVEYATNFDSWSRGRHFCITHSKHLAWIPAASRPGDVIAKLQGLRVPLMLRPSAESTVAKTGNPDGASFTILGDCYVQGMMFAECEDHGNAILRESHVLVIR